MAALSSRLEEISWNSLYNTNDVSVQVEHFNSTILNLYNEYVPVKTRLPRNEMPWFNSRIKALIWERDYAYKLWKTYKTDYLQQNFKYMRNKTTKAIKDAKQKFCFRKLDPSLSSKILWKNIRNIGIKKSVANCDIDPDELNEYFVRSCNRTDDTSEDFSLNDMHFEGFSFNTVTPQDVILVIKSIKSDATGIDGLDARFLRLILPYIVPHLTHIINSCITTSSFPTSWKYAKVIPINKKPNLQCKEDFRSNSILPFCSKVAERVMCNQIMAFVTNQSLLYA